MFKIESITFIQGIDRQEYKFSMNSFIYGPNTVGKTALTKALDFILGSSDELFYQGLDGIESIEALLSNNNTFLWIKRTIGNEFFYRRTPDSEYTAVGLETYKKNIGLILNQETNSHFLEIYEKIFDEHVTFRSFSFLNFIEEKGLGDLSVVFTKAKDLKHQIRIRNIMKFFFNFENIEQIYEKSGELEQCEEKLSGLNNKFLQYESSLRKIKKTFSELQIKHTSKINEDYIEFLNFKKNFYRNEKYNNSDLIYLTKASFSLSEEIKLYYYMRNQSENMIKRKSRVSRLLSTLSAIVEENPNYSDYSSEITEMIKEIDDENIILALTDYKTSIQTIQKEKEKIDQQIEKVKSASTELEYEVAIKKIGSLETAFSIVKENIEIDKINNLRNRIENLKKELKSLKNSFDKNNIIKFNETLTEQYLSENIDVKHLNEDRAESNFLVEFDPFRSVLFTKHMNEDGIEEHYQPGSMARQTHLQILTYLCMFDYLKTSFSNFIYMPVLIIDSANQPMGLETFKQLYPFIIEYAQKIGVQTFFLSKDKIEGIKKKDMIDISNGLNKFHKQKNDDI